ncbi:hypothetical protein EC07798_0976 [Escherichia coli 07798]|nr:hypothetical protein EC07798_0976 [Escherichia coli 07798]KDT58198.1 hypothetical protein AB76_4329 [Escherichia coli 3-267-03_S1_C3]
MKHPQAPKAKSRPPDRRSTGQWLFHVKNCNIEYLPQLLSEITSIIVQ